jgi:hypothetical protein
MLMRMLPNVTFIPQIEVTAITAAMDENTKEGRRDGTGGRRIGATRKNWRGVCVPGDL